MIQFALEIFQRPNDKADLERSKNVLYALLTSLTAIDQLWLREYPDTPMLYEAGVRYQREPLRYLQRGRIEQWRDIPTVLRHRAGDCEDLSCYRAAEIREEGINAWPLIDLQYNRRKKRLQIHILVERADGLIEDPSKRLGMRGPGKFIQVAA